MSPMDQWPVDYPCVVIRNWPPDKQTPGLSVTIGQMGKVIGEDNKGNYNVQFPKDSTGRSGSHGWVPAAVVTVGSTRSVGEGLGIEMHVPPSLTLSESTYYDSSDGMLSRTISGLLSAYWRNRKDFPTRLDWLENELDTPQKIRSLEVKIIKGFGVVSPQMLALWRSGNFSADDLRKASHPCGYDNPAVKGDQRSGVYKMVLSDFIGQPNRKPEVYVGHTRQTFDARYHDYIKERGYVKSNRAVIVALREARSVEMFPVCILEGLQKGDTSRLLAEEVILDMTQSINSAVLDFADLKAFNGDEVTSKDSAVIAVAKSVNRKVMGSIITNLCTAVFKKTGWPGCVNRAKSDKFKPYGVSQGLNMQPPISEIRNVATPWIMTEVNGMLNFRRTNFVTWKHANNMVLLAQNYQTIKGRNNGKWQAFKKPSSDVPPEHASTHVVFEVFPNGSDLTSRAPLSQNPLIGKYDDHADSLRIAMRSEWPDEDTGEWLTTYYQMGGSDDRVKGAPTGGTQFYNISTGLRHFLLQQSRTPNKDNDSWMWDFGTARVKKITIDHLQNMILVNDVNDRTMVPAPKRRPIQEIAAEYEALAGGSDRVLRVALPTDKTYPIFPGGGNKDKHDKHTSCNGCYRAKQTGVRIGKWGCKKVPGENVCDRCQRLALPCVFSPSNLFNDKQEAAVKLRLAFGADPDHSGKGRQAVGPFVQE